MILADVGNSVTKIACCQNTEISLLRKVPTAQLSYSLLREIIQNFPMQDCILCSVVPKCNVYFENVFLDRIYTIDPSLPLGIAIDYPNPKEIGADRLANAIALASFYGYPAVAIDFGTATTFDIVNHNGAYCGGVIAPGLNLMRSYLHEKTALLPVVELKEPLRAIAQSTEEAMRVGAVLGYRGMVLYLIEKIKEELGCPLKIPVIATGGQAHLICGRLNMVDQIDNLLTLKGIRIIGENLIKRRMISVDLA